MKKRFLKIAVFVLISILMFTAVQEVLVGDSDKRDEQRIAGFFDLPKNSLDAVFLGSSATYTFWNAPVAWAEYGLAIYPLSNSAQPSFAAKYLIEDARKLHPDALFIINVSHILKRYEQYLDKLLINYPFSINKLKMASYLYDQAGFSWAKKIELLFPIVRYHERWNEITLADFYVKSDEYMGGSHYNVFLNQSKDVSKFDPDFSLRTTLEEFVVQGMNDIMDYCEQEDVKTLFIIMPQAVGEDRIANQNTIAEMIEDRGLDFLDLRKHMDEIGLDLKTDYYNERHTNLHGSLKVTDYLAKYFIENYGFEDKRGDPTYQNWQTATDRYMALIKPYLFESDYKYLSNAY